VATTTRKAVPDHPALEALAPTRETLMAAGELEACRAALKAGRVTFHDVATAWFRLCDPQLSDAERRPFAELHAQLLETFAAPRGGIVTAYLCRNLRVAAVLTDAGVAAENPDRVLSTGEAEPARGYPRRAHRVGLESPEASSSAIHLEPIFGDPEDWKAKEILFSCLELHYRALEFLNPKPRKICLRMIFCIITALLGALDARKGMALGSPGATTVLDPAEVAGLERELRRAGRYLDRSVQRQAQLEYFVGMVAGWFVVLALYAAACAVGSVAFGRDLIGEPLLLAALAGGLGAVVSVMQRMTSGRLRLVSEDGRRTIQILGGIRPVLGATLGIVLYVLLAGGLLPFDPPASADGGASYYVLGLAFIAGFSERFAQDMLSGAAGGLTSEPATAAVSAEPPGRGGELPIAPR
jgi:hypothetical protein